MKLEGIKACVFDAYGTLFDVHSAVAGLRIKLGDKADGVSALWRSKQLEYTWLRSLMNEYVDFWQVTQDGLDYALQSHRVHDPSLRDALMQAYLSLDCYAEVPGVLSSLRSAGMANAILSNGSPKMLEAAVRNSNIAEDLDQVLSVDSLGIYKPHPSVYELAVDRLHVEPDEICFLSSNAFDVAGAATFGFKVCWVNRFGQVRERLPGECVAELSSLSELVEMVGDEA